MGPSVSADASSDSKTFENRRNDEEFSGNVDKRQPCIVSAGLHWNLTFWSLSGELLYRKTRNGERITCLKRVGESTVCAGCSDGILRRYDISTNRMLLRRRFVGHSQNAIYDLDYTANDKLMISTTTFHSNLILWRIDETKTTPGKKKDKKWRKVAQEKRRTTPLHRLKSEKEGYCYWRNTMFFDSKKVMSVGKHHLHVHDTEKLTEDKVLKNCHQNEIKSIDYDNIRSTIITAAHKQVSFFDVRDYTRIHDLPIENTVLSKVLYLPESHSLLVGGNAHGENLLKYDLRNYRLLKQITAHETPVVQLISIAEQNLIATSSERAIKVWDMDTLKQTSRIIPFPTVKALCYMPDRRKSMFEKVDLTYRRDFLSFVEDEINDGRPFLEFVRIHLGSSVNEICVLRLLIIFR